ncbi:DMT family transporter [Pseudanabaena sp. PCC 6802]|uniref:DMT family transporter n=1 Tax=Pseudanabaena sp. PCC 6802 TaxID=118173 RepID=UPI00034C5009|nr:DMT family transporter [Pseudanabaena sp. PCC 6802]
MDDPNSQPNSYEKALTDITEDLANLRANLLGKLGREIISLQTQKSELTEDIQKLQAQRKEVEVQLIAEQGLSAQDIQRQQWIEQLAQSIAVHLRAEVDASNAQSMQRHSDTIERLTVDLDNTLQVVFQSLQRDIETYQNDWERQMQRMHGQRQQAELLLAALIERIDQQLERAKALEQDASDRSHMALPAEVQGGQQTQPIIYVSASPPPSAARSAFGIRSISHNWWKGFLLLLGAAIALSLQNILLRIIFVPVRIFGSVQFGGLVGGITASLSNPSAAHAIVVLLLRMVFAVPLMWLVASQVFRVNVAKDLKGLLKPERRLLLARVGLSSLVQFISFVLLYMAIASMKPAIATGLFFTFPAASILLNWIFFSDRPHAGKWQVFATIALGGMLIYNLFGLFGTAADKLNLWGGVAAISSGITFAIYLLTSQACFRQINPVSFTTINFAMLLGFSIPFTPFFWSSFSPSPGLWGMGAAIALTTVSGYILTHFGTKLMGAAQALIVSASSPVLTAVLALAILSDSLSLSQAIGICLVSVGMGWLSWQSIGRKQPGSA